MGREGGETTHDLLRGENPKLDLLHAPDGRSRVRKLVAEHPSSLLLASKYPTKSHFFFSTDDEAARWPQILYGITLGS